MRDYPAVPNVFRINSTSSILLDDQHKIVKNEHENMNGDINYHNNSHGVRHNSCSFIDTITNVGPPHNNGCGSTEINGILNVNSGRLSEEDRLSSPINNHGVHGQLYPKRNNYMLWIITPVAASFAVAIVIASLAGPQWLLTEEKLPNINYNGTSNFNVADDGVYVTKYTKSSLWILCASQGSDYYCTTIDYFPHEEYSPDPNDSTMAIPYAITRSTPFFIISGVVLLISYIVLMIAMCSQQHSLYFFTSGILFIISGLLMLIGLIMYISIFKAEIGSKLRPKSTLQPPLFTFRYGQSFFLYVIGFISTEFVGVLNVFLFISLQQIGREKTLPCFPYNRTPEKIKDIDTNLKQFNIGDASSSSANGGYNCKKHHHQPALPIGYFSPFTQRRYFFEKAQNCDVHAKNVAKSLNELYTEPAPKISPFDMPEPEYPLTRSVSTTTEIFSNNNNTSSSNNNIQNNRFDSNSHRSASQQQLNGGIQKSFSKDSLNDMCGITKSILSTKRTKSKDELFSEFCERAGQRPKPKNIYYIENERDADDDRQCFVVDSSLRKNRRNSCMPTNIRKTNLFNSNTSLKDINKSYPKNLFDFESTDHTFLNNHIDNNYFQQSQNNSNRSLYQSRTLPRDFLKRNVEFADENETRRVSASGVYAPRGNYGDYYKKSYDTLASRNYRQRDDDIVSVHWPNAIPASPSSFSTRSQFRINAGNLYAQKQQHQQQQHHQQHQQQHHHQQHQQNRRSQYYGETSPDGSDEFGTFDLDKIENERRKSHASLFDIDLDYHNGTPV